MDAPLTRLYPLPSREQPLEGTYFAHDVRSLGSPERPFVYANFVSSLDGRISQIDRELGRFRPPRVIANPRDWRLHKELAAQADAILTSSSRLNGLLAEDVREVHCAEQMDEAPFAQWRRERGLPPWPVCMVLSKDLELQVDELLDKPHDNLIVLAGSQADRAVARRLEVGGIEVRVVKQRWVVGADVEAAARAHGFRALYTVGGPDVLYTMLDARRLDRLYLTVAHLTLGGRDFDTLVRGDTLLPPHGFRVHELYLDPATADKPEILYASYNAT